LTSARIFCDRFEKVDVTGVPGLKQMKELVIAVEGANPEHAFACQGP
jgi:hypothetical protein